MGNFSRDTFNALNRYVGVRLQQGVPLVDADWNEQEDIRRFELEAFLKWFVGNGVPEGNDGFRIMNVLSRSPDITAEEIIDFVIRGGDGTPKGAGRCLVDGWDVINESNIRYTEQPLFEDPDLAARWRVALLPSLEAPAAARTDTVYLDVWEREVDSEEDPNLVNSAIGIETCVRKKREWVVRVETGATEPPADRPKGHVFYPLAYLNYPGQPGTSSEGRGFTITDLRRTGLSLMQTDDIRQITVDAFGPSYTLDHDGQPNLRVSLRDAINAILQRSPLATPELQLTIDAAQDDTAFALEDSSGDIWVFWHSNRSGNSTRYDIWYDRCHNGDWRGNTQLTKDAADDFTPFALEDRSGDIWVFWHSSRSGNLDIWYNRYHSGNWEGETQLTKDAAQDYTPFALEDSSGDIWVFWRSNRSGNYDIWYKRCHNGKWEGDTQLTTDTAHDLAAFALGDSTGDIWVFWQSNRSGNWDIWYDRCHNGDWRGNTQLTKDAADDSTPFALEDRSGDIWVFWQSSRSGNWDIWYKRCHNGKWEGDTQLTTDAAQDYTPFALEDRSGDIWVFWQSTRSRNYDIWYNRCHSGNWEGDSQLTTGTADDQGTFALGDSTGDIWIFWQSKTNWNHDIFYRKLISSI